MHFNAQPTLETDLIILRPLQEADRAALFAVASDPLVWEQHPERHRYQPDVFKDFFDALLGSESTLVAVDTKTAKVIGASRYYEFAPGKSVAIGYTFLARECWGQGHNRDMKRLMLDHAFQYVPAVIFHVGENNMRSRKAMEKIGARLIGTEDRKRADGSSNPSVIFQVTR